MKSLMTLSAAVLLSLGLAACGADTSGPDSTQPAQQPAKVSQSGSPTAVIDSMAKELSSGNLLAVMQLSMPADKFAEAKTKWATERSDDPPSAEDKAKFAEMMTKLTAADAEEQMMAELEPQLVEYDTKLAMQKPMMVGMGQGFASQAIQESKDLTSEQKTQATEALSGAATWLNETNFGDRDLARKAIKEAIATAKALDMKSLDEVETMEFETMLGKAGTVFQGAKRIVAVYGFDINKTLASVKSEVVSQEGDNATVKVNFTMFDKPLSFQTEMVRMNDRWYGKKAIEQMAEEMEDNMDDASDDAGEVIEDTEEAVQDAG